VGGLAAWSPWRSIRPPRPLRLNVDLGGDAPLGLLGAQFGNAVAISPNGSTIAFIGQRNAAAPPQLYVRRLDEVRATLLPGTEGANAPFFSPDGVWLGFDTGLELKKVAVTGGAPILLASLTSMRGASWAPDGSMVFSPGQRAGTRLMLLPAVGGVATPVTTLAEGEGIHAWPQVLPGGNAVLYTSSRVTSAYNDANIVVQPLPTGAPKVIQRGGYHGVYVRSGHILYVHDGALLAIPFDVDRLQPTGSAVRVLEGLGSNGITGGAQFSVSDTGTLVYRAGPSLGGGTPIDIVDRQGTAKRLRAALANWFTPAFSADGRRLALGIREGPSETGDIWVHEIGQEPLTRVTSDPGVDGKPIWTPDGRRLTFASDRGDQARTQNLFWQLANGSGVAERLTTGANEQLPGSWHPSGRFLAFEELHATTMRDVMILPMEGDEASGWKAGVPTRFVGGPQMDWDPRFSPDGDWLAYASSESGRSEVYVRPFPGPGPAVQVSSGGGEFATWSTTRDEIVYGLEGQVMIAAYAVHGPRFTVETPRPWPGGRYQTRGRNRMFDLHPDGDHIVLALAAAPAGSGTNAAAQFVFNFFEELRRIAP
jgi:Tol biopolymer transport system component